MVVKILEDRSEGCEIHIHCQSREDEEVKQLIFLLEANRKRIPLPARDRLFCSNPPRSSMRKRWKEAYFCTRQTRYTPPPIP